MIGGGEYPVVGDGWWKTDCLRRRELFPKILLTPWFCGNLARNATLQFFSVISVGYPGTAIVQYIPVLYPGRARGRVPEIRDLSTNQRSEASQRSERATLTRGLAG